jgi:hypothetical protein
VPQCSGYDHDHSSIVGNTGHSMPSLASINSVRGEHVAVLYESCCKHRKSPGEMQSTRAAPAAGRPPFYQYSTSPRLRRNRLPMRHDISGTHISTQYHFQHVITRFKKHHASRKSWARAAVGTDDVLGMLLSISGWCGATTNQQLASGEHLSAFLRAAGDL